MPGLHFEDMTPGRVIDAEWSRRVTEADDALFRGLTMNPAHPVADADGSGRPAVDGLLALGLMVGMSVHNLTFGTAVAELGMTDLRFPAPLLAGDAVRAATTVVSVRDSPARPDAGIATLRHEMRNQRGQLVATCERVVLVLRRPPHPGEVLVA